MLTILLNLFLVDWHKIVGILLRAIRVYTARMPQKVLKELVGVLLLYDLAGCLNDIADILDELLSIGGKSADFDE